MQTYVLGYSIGLWLDYKFAIEIDENGRINWNINYKIKTKINRFWIH